MGSRGAGAAGPDRPAVPGAAAVLVDLRIALPRWLGRDYAIQNLGPLPEAVARAVRTHSPYALCFSCLAVELGVSEPALRSAAQLVLVQEDFKVIRRVCYRCSRVDDALVPDKDSV